MTRQIIKLSQCAPGTPFRLFSKYRDKSPRPRFKWGHHFLTQKELTVEESKNNCVLVSFRDKGQNIVVPLSGEIRIAL